MVVHRVANALVVAVAALAAACSDESTTFAVPGFSPSSQSGTPIGRGSGGATATPVGAAEIDGGTTGGVSNVGDSGAGTVSNIGDAGTAAIDATIVGNGGSGIGGGSGVGTGRGAGEGVSGGAGLGANGTDRGTGNIDFPPPVGGTSGVGGTEVGTGRGTGGGIPGAAGLGGNGTGTGRESTFGTGGPSGNSGTAITGAENNPGSAPTVDAGTGAVIIIGF